MSLVFRQFNWVSKSGAWLCLFLSSQLVLSAAEEKAPQSAYSFVTESIEGKKVSMKDFKGTVALIVNTASQCGFTPQYKELETIHQKYKAKGFKVLGFPSNDFGKQEPGSNSEIKDFCTARFGVTFPLFSKGPVKGPEKQPIFKYLTEQSGKEFKGEIRWNFTKFLVDKEGRVVGRFGSMVKPTDSKVTAAIEKALKF